MLSHEAEMRCPRFPGYEVIEKIGRGGMGEVYLAKQQSTQQLTAIKTIHSSLIDANYLDRFQREINILSDISHPHVIELIESGKAVDTPYLVMEYLSGGTLRNQLVSGECYPLHQASDILLAIGDALVTLHDKGIIHRDLKPENILLDQEYQPKLTDFGLAAHTTELGCLTTTGQVLGTMDYVAPEVRANLPVDERADQYGWGVLAYEMLTGRRPLGRFKPPSIWNPHLSSEIDAVLLRALQNDPDDRYPSLEQLVHHFRHSLKQAKKNPARRRRRALAGLFSLLILTGAFFSISSLKGDHEEVDLSTKQSISNTSNRVDYFRELAEKHSIAHRRDLAIDCYTQAITLAPRDSELYIARGHSHLLNGMPQLALNDLNTALQFKPDSAEAFAGLGEVYLQLNDLRQAFSNLNRSISLNPNHANTHAHRGRVYRLQKEYEKALTDFTKAVELDSDCGIAWFYRGKIHQSKRQYQQAINDYQEAVRCTPDNPFAQAALSYVLSSCPDKELRNGRAAVVHALRACQLSRWKEPVIVRRLAQAYLEHGDVDSAIHYCKIALKLRCSDKEERRILELLHRCQSLL